MPTRRLLTPRPPTRRKKKSAIVSTEINNKEILSWIEKAGKAFLSGDLFWVAEMLCMVDNPESCDCGDAIIQGPTGPRSPLDLELHTKHTIFNAAIFARLRSCEGLVARMIPFYEQALAEPDQVRDRSGKPWCSIDRKDRVGWVLSQLKLLAA